MEAKQTIPFHIELHDGFEDDTVTLKIYNNGEQVFDKTQTHVTTNLAVSLARNSTGQYSLFEPTNISNGEVEVKVNIPSKDLIDTHKFMINSETYVAISITEPKSPSKKINFFEAKEPFRHL
jgi:hypothetical protein